MNALRLCLALGPVALYLLLLGTVNLSRRPRLVSGVRDAAILALAVSGLVIVGPMELFFPFEAAAQFGTYVWLLLLALYAMCVALVLLTLRPRLVIYNLTVDMLRPILADVVARLDSEARWAGDSLALPTLGVQLYVENYPTQRCVSLVSIGDDQRHQGWRQLEAALRGAMTKEEVPRNPHGITILAIGLLMIAAIVLAIVQEPHAVAQSFWNFVQSLSTGGG